MALSTQAMPSIFEKRFSALGLTSSMYPGNYPGVPQPTHPEFGNVWPDGSTTGQDYSARSWQEPNRRVSIDPHARYQQPFLSDCRTTISQLDSPAFQSPLLPSEALGPSMIPNTSRVPRAVGFMDSPLTESEDLSDHSSPGWEAPWSFPYDGRSPPDVKRSIRSNTSSPDWPSGLNVSVPPYDSQWTDIITGPDSSVTPYTPQQTMLLNGLVFPNRFSPLPESPSPPPMYQDTTTVVVKPDPHASRGSVDPNANVKRCSHCKATSTPLWRRDPATFKPLCNACGLYLQQRNRLRPQELIDADADDGDTTDESDHNYVGPECSHCRTHHTSVWRRSKTGAQLCNACGVYARLRGKPRPLSLKRNKIKPRSKHPKP
ncbi:hypothetical protein EST38_g7597 [Candolleomyces aberdarensis]|uniref:GATA-type domain-containing protein n=1 Tax=Candolleomyces aberdarensis TaxID=2316362 RepID=A0A4Q2DI36_9AGAR|nr:hypothetical protein EST38_g7597 [Candolleomyces aberdarensis]